MAAKEVVKNPGKISSNSIKNTQNEFGRKYTEKGHKSILRSKGIKIRKNATENKLNLLFTKYILVIEQIYISY